MFLIDVQLFPVELTCTHPSDRTPDVRQHVLVKLVADEGLVGWGEITGQAAHPLTGPNVDDLAAGLRQVLVGCDPFQVSSTPTGVGVDLACSKPQSRCSLESSASPSPACA